MKAIKSILLVGFIFTQFFQTQIQMAHAHGSFGSLDRNFLAAALGDDFAEVKYLLKVGANVDAQDRYGNMALHYAAGEGYTKIVELLIEKGANAKARNKDEKTPLDLATYKKHSKIIKLLSK